MDSMKRDSMKRWAGLLTAAAGLAAQAAPATQDQGIMTFPHVRVVSQQAAPPRQPAADAGGFKAYKDPATGKLGDPSPEQAAELDAAIRASRAGRLNAASPRAIHPRQGGVGVVLDASRAHYAVARKAPSAQGEQK